MTIPSSIVQNSQYPFRDAGEVVITFEPESQLMIVSKEDIDVTTQDLETLIKKSEADLKCILVVRHPTK